MNHILFNPIKPESVLHESFIKISKTPKYRPARLLMDEVFADYDDRDGNFLEQFQTTGFDARTFELFLFQMLRSKGWEFNTGVPNRPDFCVEKEGIKLCIEATTANPPTPANYEPFIDTSRINDDTNWLHNEIPIRFGSPLFTKLNKRYWELPHVKGKPLVLAIQSFHESGSLSISSSPLSSYLYGIMHNWQHDENGRLIITPQDIDSHQIPGKVIPSGFFNQPDANNISAILFCNTGTVAKFNRMGHQGKYNDGSLRMYRMGTRYRMDPNATQPQPFLYEVGRRSHETWSDSTVLIHNPNCKYPIAHGVFGADVEENLVDGQVISTFHTDFLPYYSNTFIFPSSLSRRTIEKSIGPPYELLKMMHGT